MNKVQLLVKNKSAKFTVLAHKNIDEIASAKNGNNSNATLIGIR